MSKVKLDELEGGQGVGAAGSIQTEGPSLTSVAAVADVLLMASQLRRNSSILRKKPIVSLKNIPTKEDKLPYFRKKMR